MKHIFISYAKEDLAVASMVAGALERAKFPVWLDQDIPPGKTWDETIGRALDGAACVIVLWSKQSVGSRWVREEAERAASRSCLIPVFIEQVAPPFGFGLIQAADLSGWRGDERAPTFTKLLSAVTALMKPAQGAPESAADGTPLPIPEHRVARRVSLNGNRAPNIRIPAS
jgi:TIR domain-containing protein